MKKDKLAAEIAALLDQVRKTRPLIHNVTNYVTVNDCANVTLAVGASPIMADDIGEAADIASVSSALVLNMGTLNARTVESMIAAGKAANAAHVPVVFDPVGAGASSLRNEAAGRIVREVELAVLRGNLSEIKFIAGLGTESRGVDEAGADAADSPAERASAAKELALRLSTVVAVTGAVDVITDGARTVYLENGVPALSLVTGTGCMCTALIGAFAGAAEDMLLAAAGGIACMGVAGELALERTEGQGTGSFRVAVLDAVSRLTGAALRERIHAHEG